VSEEPLSGPVDEPQIPDARPPDASSPVTPSAGPPRADERYPFWGWSDLLLFVGMTVPSMLLGVLVVKAAMAFFRVDTRVRAAELLPAQFIGYAALFGVLYLILRGHYGRPFWASLAWNTMKLPAGQVALSGVGVALAVAFSSALLKTPETDNPMKELLSDRSSMLLIAIFGTTMGPLCEELAFRGFLQPLLVRSLGTVAGIVAAAVPFGLLHLQQYGYSWRHALLITSAGAAFGWMRQATGSTKASTLMHASYNGLFFVALLAQRKAIPQAW
jgi:membrane protease YdiL (CAAX protease family)